MQQSRERDEIMVNSDAVGIQDQGFRYGVGYDVVAYGFSTPVYGSAWFNINANVSISTIYDVATEVLARSTSTISSVNARQLYNVSVLETNTIQALYRSAVHKRHIWLNG